MFLKRIEHHWWLTTSFMALLFVVSIFLPDLFQHLDRETPYQGISIMMTDAEIHYAARVREAADGHWSIANTFLPSSKEQPYLQPPLPEATIAVVSRVFSIEAITAFLLSKAVFGFLVFFAFSWCIGVVIGDRAIGLLSAIIIFFAGGILGAPWNLLSYLHGTMPNDILLFARPINPQWTVFWFCIAIGNIARWYQRSNTWVPIILASIATLILVYSYVYAWTYLLVFMALLTLERCIRRERASAKFLGIFWLIVLIGALPYISHLLSTTSHPLYVESAQRLGMLERRTPEIGVWMLAYVALGFLVLRYYRSPLVLLLGLAGVLAINQHVLTGQYIVPHHYNWYFIGPFAKAFVVGYVFLLLYRVLPKLASLLTIFSLSIALVFGFLSQAGAYRSVAQEWRNMQQFAPVLTAMQQFQSTGAVFSQHQQILDLLPIYTSVDVANATNAGNYLVPRTYLRDIYFLELRLRGLSSHDIEQQFPSSLRKELSSRLYAIYFRELLGGYEQIPDTQVRHYIDEYRSFLGKPLIDVLHDLQISTFIFTSRDSHSLAMQELQRLTKTISTIDGFTIGRVKG